MGLLDDAVRETVRAQLRLALKQTDGDRDAAAEYLGIGRRKLYNLLADHGDIAAEFPGRHGRPPKRT